MSSLELNHRDTEAQRGCGLENHPFNSVPQDGGVEVYEKAGSEVAQAQIAEELGIVDRGKPVNGFKFDDEAIINNEIETKSGAKLPTFISERQDDLPLERDFSLFKLICQTGFIDRFQQARAHRPMDVQRTSYNRSRQWVAVSGLPKVIHKSGYTRIRGLISEYMPAPLCLCASVVSSRA